MQGCSKNDADLLGRLIRRLEAAPKRIVSSGDSKIRHRRLDRRLSSDTIAELVAECRSGESPNSLCDRFGLSKGGVLKLLTDHGVAMRQQPMTSDEVDRAVQLYVEDGYSI